jgi:hypothetical protein
LTGEVLIERYLSGWSALRTVAARPGVWLPIIILAALKAAVLLAVYYFWHPSVHAFTAPILRAVFGESAIHYPGHVLLLGHVYEVIDLVLTVALGFPLITWSLIRIAGSLRGAEAAGRPFPVRLILLAPGFVIVWALFAGAWKGLPLAADALAANLSSPRLQSGIQFIALVVGLTMKGVLLYAPIFLAINRHSALSALAASRRYAAAWSSLTGMIVATSWVFEAPFDYAISRTAVLMATTGSSTVLAVLLARCALEVVAVIYLLTAATKALTRDGEEAAS